MFKDPAQGLDVTLDEFYHRRPVFIRPRRIDVDVVELVAGDHFGGVAQSGEALVDREVGERNSQDCAGDSVAFQRAKARWRAAGDDRQRKIPWMNKPLTFEIGEQD